MDILIYGSVTYLITYVFPFKIMTYVGFCLLDILIVLTISTVSDRQQQIVCKRRGAPTSRSEAKSRKKRPGTVVHSHVHYTRLRSGPGV